MTDLLILYLIGALVSVVPIGMFMVAPINVTSIRDLILISTLYLMMVVLWPVTWMLFLYIFINMGSKAR